MTITKEQWGKIIGIVLTAVIALLGVFGYDVLVIQPRDAQIAETSTGALSAGLATRSGTGYNTACYLEQGGAQLTCDSGGTIQVNSGATLDVNAGTLQFEGATADAYEGVIAITDPTADRSYTLPNLSGNFLLTTTPKVTVFGTNTITDTLTINHGLSNVTQVFCSLTQDSEANAATCSSTISGGTAVVKVWKADGATAGSVGKQVAWMVVGTP